MSRRFATLPRRKFVRLAGGKIEFAVGLLLTSFLHSRAAEAASGVDNVRSPNSVPEISPEAAVKLPEWLENLDAEAIEHLSPEELSQLLDAETLAKLGLDPELFATLLNTDLEEAIRQLEEAFRGKLKMAAAAAGAIEDGELRAAASDSDGDDAAALGEGVPLLWVIGGIAAIGGIGYAVLDGGESNDAPEAEVDAFTTNEDTPITFDVRTNDDDNDGDSLLVTQINGTAIAVNSPVAITGGSVSLGADGRLTFTPNSNFNGTPTFTYTVSDGNGGTSTATVNLTVTAVNDAPVAATDTFTTNEDTAVTINVRANDTDVEGATLTVTQVNGTAINATTPVTVTGGVVSLVNGNLVFTPAANFNGTPSFTYTVSDGNGGTATATVNGTVTAVNDAPVAVNDTFTTAEDTAFTINVRANDTDVDGGTLTVTQVNGSAINATTPVSVTGGVVSLVNGNLVFTPAANFNGTPSFTYTVADASGATSTATVGGTVTAVNDAPVSVNDTFTTAEDTAVVIDVRGNDADVDGDALTVTQVNGSAINVDTPVSVTGGVVSLVNGNLVFTPAANFNGTPSFTYTVADASGATSTATVSGTVTAVNDAPVNTIPEDITLAQNGSVAISNLSVADVDAGNSVITTTLSVQHGTIGIGSVNGGAEVTGAGTGSVTLTGTLSQINATLGAVNYTAMPGFTGADALTITTNDGSASDTDVVDLNIARVTSGIVQDGYVSGARVFVDLNGDGKFQAGEPTGFTDEFGRFSIATNQAGNIVAFGGVNTDTGLPNTVTLIAPLGSSVVNPLTTLVSAAMASGQSQAQAEAQVKASLGLPANVDLTNFDILAPGNDPAVALAAQKAAVQIVTVLKLAGEAGGADAQASVLANIGATLASGVDVDLGSIESVTSLLSNVPGIDPAVVQQVAVKAAAINQLVEKATSLDEIADTQLDTDNDNYDLPPAAEDDEADVALGGTTTIDVLANDVDPEGRGLRLVSVSGRQVVIGEAIAVTGGMVVVSEAGAITFTADPGFVGESSFTYTVADPAGGTSTGTVDVSVTPEGPVLAVDPSDFGAVFANAEALADAGVTTFDITGDTLTITDAQAGALVGAGVDFATSDLITVEAAGTQLDTTLKGLQDLHVDTVAVSGRGNFSIDAGEGGLAGLSASGLPQFDVAQGGGNPDITLNVEAGSLGNTDLSTLAGALAGAGIDHIGVNGDGGLSIGLDQANAIADAGLDFRNYADISLAVDGAAVEALDAAALDAINVDQIDVIGDTATISDAQAGALLRAGVEFAAADVITVSAEATVLNTSLKGLQDLHVDSIAVSGRGALTLDAGAGGLGALDVANLPQFDVAQNDLALDVTLNVGPGTLGDVDLSILAGSLAGAGIDHLGVKGSGELSLDLDQAVALADAGLDFDPSADITLALDAGSIGAVSGGLLDSLNVDHINPVGDVTISDGQAADFVNAGVDFAVAANVTVQAEGTQLNTTLKGLQDLHVDAVKADGVTSLKIAAGDLSGLTADGLPQFDTAQSDDALDVTLRVQLSDLEDLERLAGALRDAGVDHFSVAELRDGLDQATLDRLDAIASESGIDFLYGVQEGSVSGFASTMAAGEGYDHGQVYRELLSTFEGTDADEVGDVEIADGTASSLIEAGMLRAYLSDNVVVDATGSGDRLLTTLKEISDIGIDEIRTADQGDAPIYVDLGIGGDASAVSELTTLFKNLDLNGPEKLFNGAEKVGLVLDPDAAQALAKVDGAFEQLADMGFTEVDVLAAPNGFSIDTGAIEIKLIGQTDELYHHLHQDR